MHKSVLLAGMAFGLTAVNAVAQTAPANGTKGLEEIVVTATKRATNLQDVPVAVTALSEKAIKDLRITEFQDLTRAAASLTLTEAENSPNNAIVLRGIGTYAFSIGVEPSVAVIIDDVPVVQQAQAFDNLNDLQRIEVLRGPQGTLFGKNASAGAINIVTRDPTDHLTYGGSFTGATNADFKEDAYISGPITDRIQFRLSGYNNDQQGNVKNLYDGNWLNGEEAWGVHGKLKIEPTDDLTIVLNASYQSNRQSGTAEPISYIDLNYRPNGAATPVVPKYHGVSILPALAGITPGQNNYDVAEDNDSPDKNKQVSFSAKTTYDLGFANLISVTGYQDWEYNFSQSVDQTDLAVNGKAVPVTHPVGPGIGVDESGPYHSVEVTQEIRLASKGSGPLSYVVGGYFEDDGTHRDFTRGPTQILANWQGFEGNRSEAIFGDIDYKLPTLTTISAAGRINNEHINDSFVNLLPTATEYVSPTNIGTCGRGSAGCAGSHDDTAETYKVSISQELMRHVSTYASIATGYKGYAYDISSGYNPLRTEKPVKAEHSIAYEVGLKSRWWQNRGQLNLAAFLTDYNDFQAQSSQYIDGALQQKLNNVGKLRTEGVEIEGQARPVDWLNFFASLAYTEATVVSFPNAACYPGQLQTGTGCAPSVNPTGLGDVQNRSNTQLPNAPRFKANIGATVEQDLGGNYAGSATVTYQYQSTTNFDLLGDPLLVQRGYGITNLNFGVQRGPYTVSVFVNNVFDQHYATTMVDNFGSFGVHLVNVFRPLDSQRFAGFKLSAAF